MSQYMEAAERGEAEAQYRLGGSYRFGENYENGEGVTKDLDEAAKWYRKSAEQGNASAQNNLGRCFQSGWGVTKDLSEAVKWYRKSAEQGDADAQYSLGVCFEYGRGVTKDLNEAVTWYRKAAEQGNADAQYSLGMCFHAGRGVTKDLKEAFTLYRKSADQGNAAAEFRLGVCYENGWGVTKDLREAVAWYRKSAEQGNADAQVNLGLCYHNGLGINKDLNKAVTWYRKSAEHGNSSAQYILGVCYHNGLGATKDLKEAVMWYRRSAEKGNADAQLILGVCCENGLGVTKDLSEAVKWYHHASKRGNKEALEKLKSHADTGSKEACDAIVNLANQGNAAAVYHLEQLVQKHGKSVIDILLESSRQRDEYQRDVEELQKEFDQGKLEQAKQKAEYESKLNQLQAENFQTKQELAKQTESLQQAAQDVEATSGYISQLKQTIASTLKLSLSHPNVQDVDGNTLLMNHLLHLESDVLAEPKVSDLLKAAFNASPWHAVNREGRSLAEIILDDRVPTTLRDHARAVMETTLADSSAVAALRSAAARALHRNDPLISSISSYFDVPFSNLPVFADTAGVSHDVEQTIDAVEEAARRVPKNEIQHIQSLIGMLQSVNTPEMQHISRLERHHPDLEKRLLAIKETHRWLTEHGSIQASENIDADTLERIQDHRDLLGRQLRETEPIFAEVNAILPELDANLSSLFPQIEGRADRISPTQLNDILIFTRQHFGNIAWHQQSVVSATQTLMEALKNYATSVRSVQGDLDIHHSFMKFFLAHAGNVCSDQIPAARRHVEEIAVIRSELRSRNDIRQLVDELKTMPQILETANAAMVKLEDDLKKKKSLLTAQETVKSTYSQALVEADCQETRNMLASVEALICKINSEISTIQQQLDNENRKRQTLIDRQAQLRQQIASNLNSREASFP